MFFQMDTFIISILILVIVSAIIFYIVTYKDSKNRKVIFERIDSGELYKEIISIKKELAKSFFLRYRSSKNMAYGILLFTVFVLFVGAYAFYNASNLLPKEIKKADFIGTDKWEKIQDSISKIYENKYLYERGILVDTLTTGNAAQLAVEAKTKYRDRINRETSESLDKASKEVQSENASVSNLQLLGSITIRLMIGFFVFYLTQIFLKLYRYNLKISDFYLNKFDAILSHEAMKMSFEDTIDIFKHGIDVGSEPKTPIETAIQLIQATKEIKENKKLTPP